MLLKNIAALFFTAAAVSQPVLSTIIVTQPVASTNGKGGQKLSIEWNDDGKSPKLSSDWGRINIFLATGSQNVQFKLEQLATNLAPGLTSFRPTISKNAGPNAIKEYFLRFEGTKLQANGIPPMAFSARFTLTGMSGSFNSTIMSANNGATDPVTALVPTLTSSSLSTARSTPTTSASTGPSSNRSNSTSAAALAAPGVDALALGLSGAIAIAGAALF
ncbi:hypothetical protein K437DRAFT_221710 [Tilletiaria anomala UBC 951]|uniref:Yeast cell wall synthesis Kre9/Knh1-like N-terminal domain-containing protein n=1 Tax=Tilletiaria anomala (strain ATCC 24038 / CBS 436.72 / UBC 951) TaxID=1037660 RepID=A0A066WC52_TILAU|nr:uncharacterized protein K437DRAFT_221710 [Tilletiaria anomala UBC 951]KDN51311.1 hypothetical protein K437DRAFT_221710 [Tilletiaria anomala UBC 951]